VHQGRISQLSAAFRKYGAISARPLTRLSATLFRGERAANIKKNSPASGVYEISGMIDVNRRPYYSWQGYVFDAMVIGLDGTVSMGQAERKSKLYLYYPR
jgi:hypothetical protein